VTIATLFWSRIRNHIDGGFLVDLTSRPAASTKYRI
jgi:hypothetical protein